MENKETLLTALRIRFKDTKGILSFNAAYDTPEVVINNFSAGKRDLLDRSAIMVLADDVWEATKHRWRYEIPSHLIQQANSGNQQQVHEAMCIWHEVFILLFAR